MPDSGWNNPWKLTAIGTALVVVTALVTGLVVAQWSGAPADRSVAARAQPGTTSATASRAESVPPPAVRRATSAAAPRPVSTVPTQAAVEACHQEAAAQA
jgi:hypothetical protein